jgi:hypothetical protein
MHRSIVAYVAHIKGVKNIHVELRVKETGFDKILPEGLDNGTVLGK